MAQAAKYYSNSQRDPGRKAGCQVEKISSKQKPFNKMYKQRSLSQIHFLFNNSEEHGSGRRQKESFTLKQTRRKDKPQWWLDCTYRLSFSGYLKIVSFNRESEKCRKSYKFANIFQQLYLLCSSLHCVLGQSQDTAIFFYSVYKYAWLYIAQ